MDNTFDMRVLKTYLRQCFDDRTIPGQAGTPRRGGKKWEGLPFGNIPISTRLQVRRRGVHNCVCVHVCVYYVHIHVYYVCIHVCVHACFGGLSEQLCIQHTHTTYTCACAKHHIQDYKSVISSLPETDQPSFFGLPANIERSSQRTISSRVISQLKVVTRIGDVEGKFDRETWATELSPILTLWKRLNQVSPVTFFSLFSSVLIITTAHATHQHSITVLLLHTLRRHSLSPLHTSSHHYYSTSTYTLPSPLHII